MAPTMLGACSATHPNMRSWPQAAHARKLIVTSTSARRSLLTVWYTEIAHMRLPSPHKSTMWSLNGLLTGLGLHAATQGAIQE